MWIWIALGAAAVLVAVFVYWALVITEGAYLGARAVALAYDLTARRYDRIKQFRPADEAWLLAVPALGQLKEVDCPLVLDVATGTGRMPRALLERPLYRGRVVGLDLSYRMLQQANEKLRDYPGRFTLVWRDAQHLPFPDQTFDAVSCLEALEFMPSPRRVLSEMARVLRPGGVFVVTNRVNWERKVMPGKAFTDAALRAMLQDRGLVRIEFRSWQVYYDLIWARKAGSPSRLGRGTQRDTEILRCPQCSGSPLAEAAAGLVCHSCGKVYAVRDGIVHMS